MFVIKYFDDAEYVEMADTEEQAEKVASELRESGIHAEVRKVSK